ncbi:MAG: hypothetical protein WBA39_19750 [Rivularia sp. (in: cyanobacteria)]
MKRFDAIAIVTTGIVSSLLISLRAAPAFGKVESISNVREERTLPVEKNSKYQPVVYTADVSSQNNENQIGDNTTILGLAAMGVGTAGLIWSFNRQNNRTLSPQSGNLSHDISIEQANPRLRKELLRLVGGDSRTANRLINGIKQSHPEKSINWTVEKVIYDLERDR